MTRAKLSGVDLMDRMNYVLRGKVIVQVDFDTWCKEFQRSKTAVGKTYVGRYFISTVFLGLDHNFGDGKPALFETMVFDRSKRRNIPGFGRSMGEDVFQDRYCTWDEAEAGHKKVVKDYEKIVLQSIMGKMRAGQQHGKRAKKIILNLN